jgi:hypothetical protein
MSQSVCIRKYSDEFGYYFAGLLEGDGTIIVPTSLRSAKGKLYYPSIQICFHLKDLPLAMHIQKVLGFGSLNRVRGKNAYNLTINNREGIIVLIHLLNGKMRTFKVYDLYQLMS